MDENHYRNLSPAERESIKEVVQDNYIGANKTLMDTLYILNRDYNFCLTPKQLERSLSQWGFSKNVRSADFQLRAVLRKQHEEPGKRSAEHLVRRYRMIWGNVRNYVKGKTVSQDESTLIALFTSSQFSDSTDSVSSGGLPTSARSGISLSGRSSFSTLTSTDSGKCLSETFEHFPVQPKISDSNFDSSVFDELRDRHEDQWLLDECLEVNKSLSGPPNGPDSLFQINSGVFTINFKIRMIRATVDYKMPVNVVTRRCLKELGFENLRHGLSPDLRKLAAKALPSHCGWEHLTLCEPMGNKGVSYSVDFLVVDGDSYGCDLLLGYEFKRIKLGPVAGLYPIFTTLPGSKKGSEKQEEKRKDKRPPQAEAADEQKHRSAEIPSSFSVSDVTAAHGSNDAHQEKTPQSWNTTPDSESENSFVDGWEYCQSPNILDVENEALFVNILNNLSHQLMGTYFGSLVNDRGDVQQEHPRYNHCAGSDGSVGMPQISESTGASSQKITLTMDPSVKRRRGRNESDEDEDQNRNNRRKRQEYGTELSDGKLLVCPYFRYDPIRYSERNMLEKNYRGCSSSFLKDISRLKQHLYRVHRRPDYYCGRCSEEFESEDALDAHTRSLTQCDISDPQYSEKMTANQLTCIKRRSPGRSSSETWYIIFRILFPGASLPSSPFAECASSDRIAAFISHAERQGPAILSEFINADLQHLPFYRRNHRLIFEEALERAFPQVIRELGRQFNQPSSQSDINSSRSAPTLPSVAREAELHTASYYLPRTITANTPRPSSRGRHPTYFEPLRLGSGPELDSLLPVDFPCYQGSSSTEAATVMSLAPNANNSADVWASLTEYDPQYSHIEAPRGYWDMSFASDLVENNGFHDNLYIDDAWPNSSDDPGPVQ